MTSRVPALEGTARNRLEKLLAALRDNSDPALIVVRLDHLLRFKPNQCDRDTWLRLVLPMAWHYKGVCDAVAATAASRPRSKRSAPKRPSQRH